MSLNSTQKGDRIHIGIFGKRNAGKSSVINGLTGQNIAIVSDVKGTTTDPVFKAMEILPLGPCMIVDTPGLDDEGELGQMRVNKAKGVLTKTDLALLVVDASGITEKELQSERGLCKEDGALLVDFEQRKIPGIILLNKQDLLGTEKAQEICKSISQKNPKQQVVLVSTSTSQGLEQVKDAMIAALPKEDKELHIVSDLMEQGDYIILVVPVDSAAPKGRLIMPQQQTIRDILDHQGIAIVTQVPTLAATLETLAGKVKMVITDSQAFSEVSAIVPDDIYLTSFSILFARHKGNLAALSSKVKAIDDLKDGHKVLIAEGCTHRRQCDDIGTVKIPKWLKEYTGKELQIETCSGTEFPENLEDYQLIIHCGGCTLTEKEMKYRMQQAANVQVPMLNYGIFIAYVKGIWKRSLEIFPELQ